LLKKAEPISKFDTKIKALANDMMDTMRASKGIGLAAPQVGVPLQMVVVEIDVDDNDLDQEEVDEDDDVEPKAKKKSRKKKDRLVHQYVVCNPVVTKKKGHARIEEGCLSLPEFFVEVDRAKEIVLEGQTFEGEPFRLEANGLLSICFQHELDHLDGTLLTNYVDRDEREAYRKEMREKKLAEKEGKTETAAK